MHIATNGFMPLRLVFTMTSLGTSMWANSLEFLCSKCEPEDGEELPWDDEYCWNPGQWGYSEPPDNAWQALTQYQSEKNEVDDEVLRSRARCLAATMAGLRDLTDEGLWTRDPIPVLAFVSLWDSPEDRWVIWESTHRLNSSDILDLHPLPLRNWLKRSPGRRSRQRRWYTKAT